MIHRRHFMLTESTSDQSTVVLKRFSERKRVHLGECGRYNGDSLALLPWHLRVNLGTKDISVLIHPRQRAGQES